MNLVEMAFTTNAWGGATATSPYVSGEVAVVRVPLAGTAWATQGSAAVTLTRVVDGGTVLAVSSLNPPWEYHPTLAAHSTSGGTTAYATGVGPVYTEGVPVDGSMQLVVSGGTASKAGVVYVYVD